MFDKIIDFIKKDLHVEELKNIFKKNNNYDKLLKTTEKLINTTKNEIYDINQLEIELKREFLSEALDNFDTIKCSGKHQFCFLFADDNQNSIKLMKNDLNYIFKKPSLITNEIFDEKIIKIRDQLFKKIKNIDFELILAQGDYAPYSIIKSIKNIKIDYAMLDIIFGGIILYKDKTYIFDGIDIAECILKNNPKAIILFYTGCNLSENSEEYNKIQKLSQNYPDQIFITDKDINDEARIKKIIKSFEQFLKINNINNN